MHSNLIQRVKLSIQNKYERLQNLLGLCSASKLIVIVTIPVRISNGKSFF